MRIDAKSTILAAVLAALFAISAFAMAYCVGMSQIVSLFGPESGLSVCIALTLAVFVGTGALALAVLSRGPSWLVSLGAKQPWDWLSLRWSWRSIGQVFAVVVVLWLPWFFLQFPTGMGNDTYEQLYEFQTSAPTYYYTLGITLDASFVDHHPIFDTLLYGAFWKLGDMAGSQNAGLFAFSLLQSLFTALVLAMSCCYTERLGVPKLLRIVLFAFVALFPCIPQYAMSMVKDSTFSSVFVLFFLMYLQAFKSQGESLQKPRNAAIFAAVALLCLLTKKTAFLIIAVSLVALFAYCKRGRRPLALGGACVFAVTFALLPALLYPAIGGVACGGRQEAFGILLQQALAVVKSENDLSEGEMAALSAVLDVPRASEKFAWGTVDPVKSMAYYDASLADYLRFSAAYLGIGLRHVPLYTYAAANVVAPLLCPGEGIGYYGTCNQDAKRIAPIIQKDSTGELHLDFFKPREIIAYSAPVQRACNAFFGSGLGAFVFGIGMFGGWIPLACIAVALRGNRRYALAFLPIAVSVLLLLICPANPTRYVLPFIYALPLMVGLACDSLARRAHALPSCEEGCRLEVTDGKKGWK